MAEQFDGSEVFQENAEAENCGLGGLFVPNSPAMLMIRVEFIGKLARKQGPVDLWGAGCSPWHSP